MSVLSGEWFTASRVQRLPSLLSAIPSRFSRIQLSEKSAARVLFPQVGGSIAEVQACIGVLASLGFASAGETVFRTGTGDKAVKALARGDRSALPLAILRSGVFRGQVQYLFAYGSYEGEDLVIQPMLARKGAAQLIGLL